MNAKANEWHKWLGKTAGVEKPTRQVIRRLLINKHGYARGLEIWRERRLDSGAAVPPPITFEQFQGALQ